MIPTQRRYVFGTGRTWHLTSCELHILIEHAKCLQVRDWGFLAQ